MGTRTALVTGSNRGIGFEVCRQLGRQGLRVVVTGRAERAVSEAARALRDAGAGDVRAELLDVASQESVAACAARLEAQGLEIDVLVNNAAVYPEGELLSAPPELLVNAMDLNALTVRLASEARGDVKVNSVCPGWVRTRMGTDAAPRSVEQGAETVVWLATLPADGPHGGFFRDRAPIAW